MFLYLLLAVAVVAQPQPSLRGSKASMVRQNKQADAEKLSRIDNTDELKKFVRKGLLVPLPVTGSIEVDPRLVRGRRYCRPWTAAWLRQLGNKYWSRFGSSLQINSAVRTVEGQRALRRRNANATAPGRSAHTRGSVVDIARLELSLEQVQWVRTYLLAEERAGRVEATEEHGQLCWHIMVLRDPPYWIAKKPPKKGGGKKK